jgi:hypothetical protein
VEIGEGALAGLRLNHRRIAAHHHGFRERAHFNAERADGHAVAGLAATPLRSDVLNPSIDILMVYVSRAGSS